MNYVGGGFLCIIKPNHSEPHLLLGREVYGKNKGLYADFGGGKDHNIDGSHINNTIHREVMEEFYVNINNIYDLPFVNVPIPRSNTKFYKLVVGRIDNYQPQYFYEMNHYYKQLSKGKYSKYTEMDKIVLVPLSEIIKAIQSGNRNNSVIKTATNEKIKLRRRLWKAFTETPILGIISSISGDFN
jgi:hypothetical protein